MPVPDRAARAAAAAPGVTTGPAFAQFPTALRFAIRNQARNRLAALLLVGFVPVWYLLMLALAGHKPLRFRLFSTGQVLAVDGGHLTLISAGLNALTIITGFAVFHAVHTTIGFDRRLVFAGYRQAILVAAKTLATGVIAIAVALYAGLVLLAFWQPSPAGWLAVTGGYAVMALTYGAFGLLLGVLVRGDLEGFFLIIMGGLMDTFLQNPLGNPLANKPVLEWFPSFGPMQFAVGGAFGHRFLPGHLALGLAWAAAFTAVGLVIFQYRTHPRLAGHTLAWRRRGTSAPAPGPHAQT